MRVFTTLLVDSLRLLRARVLFWISLWITVFVGLVYLSIGFDENGFSFLFGLVDVRSDLLKAGSPFAETFYLGIFGYVAVGIWLSWAAVALGLISCAPIFPDFLSEGSIGIALSKPVSRLSLFIGKYVGALLFVVLQVTLFCVIVFFAIRWRIGVWNPSIFWAVPLVTLVFSYLYSVVVLVSVRTRSALAGILAAVGVWFLAWAGQMCESWLYSASRNGMSFSVENGTPKEDDAWKKWHRVSVVIMGMLPKTGETMSVMNRLMVVQGRQGFSAGEFISGGRGSSSEAQEVDETVTRHSTLYVLGTSAGFELVLLGLAAWTFCRRDY